jgi:hypothetical protein
MRGGQEGQTLGLGKVNGVQSIGRRNAIIAGHEIRRDYESCCSSGKIELEVLKIRSIN